MTVAGTLKVWYNFFMADREDKFKTSRLIQIEKWIRSGTYPSVEDMVKKHGVSRRTILRDIEFLQDRYMAPIEYDHTRKGYYYTDPTFMIQNVVLTEGDLFTISTLMPLMEQYKNTPLEASFKNIMAKVTDMLPDQVTVDTAFLNQDVVFISDPLPKIERDVFKKIFKAIKLRRVMNFKYRSSYRRDYKDKIFDPYQVLCQKGNWYVIGYDHSCNDRRVYALSRIKELCLAKDKFEIPDDYVLEKEVDPSFGIWRNKDAFEDYELLFSEGLATYILERTWHKNQVAVQNEDGSVTLKFSSNQKQQIKSWLLSFGSSVKVLKPLELQKEILSDAEKIIELYKGISKNCNF